LFNAPLHVWEIVRLPLQDHDSGTAFQSIYDNPTSPLDSFARP